MRALPATFIIFIVLLSSFSVAVADSSFNETISTPALEMPSLTISDYVNKALITLKAWRFDSTGLIETNTGIYVDKRFWDWLSGSIQESANLTDTALKWAQVFNQKVQNDEPIQWIFITWTKPNERLKEALEALGAEVLYVDDDINAISLKAKPSLIKNLVYSQAFDFDYRFYIREVWPDLYVETGPTILENETTFTPANVTITPEQVSGAIWNIKLVKADLAWSKEGITGKGVTVAVLDTGVDCDHVMLQGACVGFENFVTDEPAKDLNGHGTHVAGIIAGRPTKVTWEGKQVYVSGVAPEANILAVKVLGQNGGGTMTQIIQGLDYVVEWKKKHPGEPIVISMSLGSPFGSPRDPMVQKVEQIIREEHIPAIIAAGNEFAVIDSPGLASGAITVAAVDRDMKVADFSGKGPGLNIYDIKPDIAAPGVKILSAKAGTKNEFIAMSGTSMATPHVSGVVALILQKHGDLTPETIKLILEKTAYPLDGIDALPTWSGAGVVDAYAAVKAEPNEAGGLIDFLRRLLG
ncbi:S8 family peptidase [Palaeococcus ferrophilus]|uniref:S8 family peptidase n=1 Tax=Palaeococcus ferrophilus TaxID=83868 RepID=UPI00064EFE26|nr:S8 family peptidase [Palaeococcus ferrophilus]